MELKGAEHEKERPEVAENKIKFVIFPVHILGEDFYYFLSLMDTSGKILIFPEEYSNAHMSFTT